MNDSETILSFFREKLFGEVWDKKNVFCYFKMRAGRKKFFSLPFVSL